jgi:Kef-type K+ transport system membrane component KefB
MHEAGTAAQFLLTIGGIILLGLVTITLGRKTFLPRVTLLLIFGMIIGKEGLNIIPMMISNQFEIVANMALLMVGFLLGGKLTKESLQHSMSQVLWISISAAVVTTAVVAIGLIVIGVSMEIAILLGCLASATAPAAILDVVLESEQKGEFADKLLSIVALDDAWALMMFAVGVAIVSSLNGDSAGASPAVMALKDIGGAVVLGLLLGFPAAYLTGRLKQGRPILSEALGVVFLCGGLALWMGVSFLIASIVLGAVVANFAKHHEYSLNAIDGVEWPFMVLFFVLAGAELDLKVAGEIGLTGLIYIICRSLGKVVGARVGGQFSGADQQTKDWMGVAMLPQAGVAIGMALVASNYFPEYRQTLLFVATASTVFFEIVGPVFTRLALAKAK